MQTYRVVRLSQNGAATGEVWFCHTAADAAYYARTGCSVVQVAPVYVPSKVAAQLPIPDFCDF